jgi:tetratricopeptide (TPR) repeat protein
MARIGDPIRMVPRDSAICSMSEGADRIAIKANHPLMVKFESMADQHYLRVISQMKQMMANEDHPAILNYLFNHADMLLKRGRREEAEKLCKKVLGPRKRILGQNHLDTLESMYHLACTLFGQGRWKEAQELYTTVIEGCMWLRDQEDLKLNSMCFLARTFYAQKQWKESHDLLIKVLEGRKANHGERNAITLESAYYLANTLYGQSKWSEAEKLHARVLEARKKVLDDDNPEILRSMHYLAGDTIQPKSMERSREIVCAASRHESKGTRGTRPTHHQRHEQSRTYPFQTKSVETGRRILYSGG